MSSRVNINNDRKKALIFAKKWGTTIVLNWSEWPNGKPAADPTTGATLSTTASAPILYSCFTKAFVHFVQGAESQVRMHAELQTGDAIVDFSSPLLRVTTHGDTDLDDGEVIDQWAFDAENRNVSSGGTPAEADEIQIESLEGLYFVMDGQKWVQCKVGKDLIKSWDHLFADRKMFRTIALRKAT